MALRFYRDAAFTEELMRVLGSLNDSGNQFSVSEEPYEVRVFDSAHPEGQLLTKNTATPTAPGSGEWGYSASTVYLGDALVAGQIAVAFSAGYRIFEGINTVSGLAEFLVTSANADDRTKQQQIFVKNDAADKQYTDVQIAAISDFVVGAGADSTWHQVAPDNSGAPGTWQSPPLSLPDIPASGSASFWIKASVPQGNESNNFRDIYIELSAIESSTL